MNLKNFQQAFQTDAMIRTQFASALATELGERGLTSDDVDMKITTDANNVVNSLVLGADSGDALMQLRVADAALSVLKEQGVSELSGIQGIDRGEAQSWNVIYKNGGWIINSLPDAGDILIGGGGGG